MVRDHEICNFHAEPKLSGQMNSFQINIQAPSQASHDAAPCGQKRLPGHSQTCFSSKLPDDWVQGLHGPTDAQGQVPASDPQVRHCFFRSDPQATSHGMA